MAEKKQVKINKDLWRRVRTCGISESEYFSMVGICFLEEFTTNHWWDRGSRVLWRDEWWGQWSQGVKCGGWDEKDMPKGLFYLDRSNCWWRCAK